MDEANRLVDALADLPGSDDPAAARTVTGTIIVAFLQLMDANVEQQEIRLKRWRFSSN